MSCSFCSCFGKTKKKLNISPKKTGTFEIKDLISNKSDLLKHNANTLVQNEKIAEFSSPFRAVQKRNSKLQIKGLSLEEPTGSPVKNSEVDFGSNSKYLNTHNKIRYQLLSNKKEDMISLAGLNDETSQKNSVKKHFEFRDKFRCMFCGGADCKHENYLYNNNSNAIEGLHSNFITNDIIASQRPSTVLIKKFNLVQTFKALNIGLIVNVQREGEHPFCGPNANNLSECGFSYNHSVFSADDIKCRLSGWKDMSVPDSMNFMLEIVKEMTITVQEDKKRVLVHCHAGYGRTGVVIACYLLYNSQKETDTVIKEIRSKRANCIEKSEQRQFCEKFEDFIKKSRVLFSNNKEKIEVLMKRQSDLLIGEESKKFGFVPKLIVKILEKILEVKEKHNIDNVQIYKLIKGGNHSWEKEHEEVLSAIKTSLNQDCWKIFDITENLLIIIELLFDWLEDSVEYVISPERAEEILFDPQIGDTISLMRNKQSCFHPYEKEQKKALFNSLKKFFHGYEYETLFHIAKFCDPLTPNPGNEEENEAYLEMIDRFSLHLFGFRFLETFSGNIPNFEHVKFLVTGLTDIIRLLISGIRSNDDEGVSPRRYRYSSFHLNSQNNVTILKCNTLTSSVPKVAPFSPTVTDKIPKLTRANSQHHETGKSMQNKRKSEKSIKNSGEDVSNSSSNSSHSSKDFSKEINTNYNVLMKVYKLIKKYLKTSSSTDLPSIAGDIFEQLQHDFKGKEDVIQIIQMLLQKEQEQQSINRLKCDISFKNLDILNKYQGSNPSIIEENDSFPEPTLRQKRSSKKFPKTTDIKIPQNEKIKDNIISRASFRKSKTIKKGMKMASNNILEEFYKEYPVMQNLMRTNKYLATQKISTLKGQLEKVKERNVNSCYFHPNEISNESSSSGKENENLFTEVISELGKSKSNSKAAICEIKKMDFEIPNEKNHQVLQNSKTEKSARDDLGDIPKICSGLNFNGIPGVANIKMKKIPKEKTY